MATACVAFTGCSDRPELEPAAAARQAAAEPSSTPLLPATVLVRDARGDAHPPTLDITAARISNGQDRVSILARFADLRGRGDELFGAFLDPLGQGNVYVANAERTSGGRVTTTLSGGPSVSRMATLDCDVHGSWKLRRDVIRLSFPRQCVVERGALRSNVVATQVADSIGDASDWTDDVRVGAG